MLTLDFEPLVAFDSFFCTNPYLNIANKIIANTKSQYSNRTHQPPSPQNQFQRYKNPNKHQNPKPQKKIMLTLDFETLVAFLSASTFLHLFSSSYTPNPKYTYTFQQTKHKIKHKNQKTREGKKSNKPEQEGGSTC